jgi:hypothetical protein
LCRMYHKAWTSFWTQPMELLGEWVMWNLASSHFRHTRWKSLVMWVMWNLASIHLETVLVLVQNRCTVCVIHTYKLRNHFERTRWYANVMRFKCVACLGLFGESANLNTRKEHTLCRMYHKARKSFWTHSMEHLVDVGHVESCFSPFRDNVSVGARLVHGLRQTYHRLRNCFARTRWYS